MRILDLVVAGEAIEKLACRGCLDVPSALAMEVLLGRESITSACMVGLAAERGARGCGGFWQPFKAREHQHHGSLCPVPHSSNPS